MIRLFAFLLPYKIPAIIGGIVLAFSSFYVWLKVHDYNIRQEVIAEFNQKQEELLAQKKAEYEAKMEEVRKEADRLRLETAEKNGQIQKLTEEIEKDIVSKDASDPAPDYLRQVINRMQKNFGEKK